MVSKSQDIDENGTPDKNQLRWAFLKASGKDEDLDGIDDACDPEITDPILYVDRNGKSEFNKDEEDDKENNISKGMPIVLVKDINEKCYALKPEDYLSPALKPGSNGYKPRGLIKLNRLPKGVNCEK